MTQPLPPFAGDLSDDEEVIKAHREALPARLEAALSALPERAALEELARELAYLYDYDVSRDSYLRPAQFVISVQSEEGRFLELLAREAKDLISHGVLKEAHRLWLLKQSPRRR
jgi:hypothetical protein